tara:strand:+ start:13603 stop:14466 length:864 start_codon:yes stop_codon:yes gene_type:complete
MSLTNKQRKALEGLGGLASGQVFLVGDTSKSWYSQLVQELPAGMVRPSLAQAVAAARDGGGDVIVVLPGEHTLSAAVAVTKQVRITGLPGYKKSTLVQGPTTASENVFTVTGEGVTIEGLTIASDASNNSGIAIQVAASDVTVRDCAFVEGDNDSNHGINVAVGKESVSILDCSFSGLQTAVEFNNPQTDLRIQGCVFGQSTNDKNLIDTVAAATAGLLVKDCVFFAATTKNLGVDTGTTTGGLVCDCYFAAQSWTAASPGFIGDVDSALELCGNYTRAGLATGYPA